MKIIMDETNCYAACVDPSLEWKTNVAEPRAYFGFYILMGLVKEPEIRDYWAKDLSLPTILSLIR